VSALSRLSGATPRSLTDPGLWLGDDERIIIPFRAAAHSEASAATLTEYVACASERRVEHGYFPDIPKILGYQERRVWHRRTRTNEVSDAYCWGLPGSGDRVAKAVVLRDEYGYVLAILPASHHIRLDDLRMQLGLDVDLAAEYEIEELFDDCVPGAIPPVGECYGLETVVDDSIERQPEVYLEGGDHATLVHMTHAQFASLTATARHGSFSVHAWK
jgi:Ala-tRNA(Pro) deacylase